MAVTFAHRTPRVVVIGPKGKVGAKAVSMAESLGLQVDGWGRDATAKKGPYPELLKYHILVNAIKVAFLPPFPHRCQPNPVYYYPAGYGARTSCGSFLDA